MNRNLLAASGLALATALALLARTADAGTIDAVSGGSIDLTRGTTTQTSATMFWTETEVNGTLKIYLDTTNTTRTRMRDSMTVPTASRGDNKGYTLPRTLKPGKKYFFAFQGWERYPNNPPTTYALLGSFTTDAVVSVGPRLRTREPRATRTFDVSGRPSSGAAFAPEIDEDGGRISTPAGN